MYSSSNTQHICTRTVRQYYFLWKDLGETHPVAIPFSLFQLPSYPPRECCLLRRSVPIIISHLVRLIVNTPLAPRRSLAQIKTQRHTISSGRSLSHPKSFQTDQDNKDPNASTYGRPHEVTQLQHCSNVESLLIRSEIS